MTFALWQRAMVVVKFHLLRVIRFVYGGDVKTFRYATSCEQHHRKRETSTELLFAPHAVIRHGFDRLDSRCQQLAWRSVRVDDCNPSGSGTPRIHFASMVFCRWDRRVRCVRLVWRVLHYRMGQNGSGVSALLGYNWRIRLGLRRRRPCVFPASPSPRWYHMSFRSCCIRNPTANRLGRSHNICMPLPVKTCGPVLLKKLVA